MQKENKIKFTDKELIVLYNRMSIPTRALSHYFNKNMHPEDFDCMKAFDKIEAEINRRGL